MKLLAAFALFFTLNAVPCLGQAAQPEPKPQPDAQTLASILTELRGIHNDVRMGQSSQILLAEMLMQHDAVNRARQKRDDLKTRLTQIQAQQKNMAPQLAQLDAAANTAVDAQRKKQLTDNVNQLKTMLTTFKAQEQQNSDDLHDAEAQLSKEQDTLDSIQAQLDALVKQLQPAGKP